jgi:hypothetical protein
VAGGQDPGPLFRYVLTTDQRRRLRLLACACARLLGADLVCDPARLAIEASERFADGRLGRDDLKRSHDAARVAYHERGRTPDERALIQLSAWVAGLRLKTGLKQVAWATPKATYGEVSGIEARRCALVRGIFGNPFRPIVLDPSWLTSTVVALARQMYESRDFSPMPILADALQDAGCDNPDVLAHCRGPGPHVRGCWVVDLVLGKA